MTTTPTPRRLATGAAAGLMATVPMTAAMVAMHRQLPAWQRYALPPRRITMRAASKLGLRHKMDQEHRTAATLAAHFGYGTAVGALLGAFAPRGTTKAAVTGAGFGLLVWTASYLGLMPALDLHPPATRDTTQRNALMILAHLVWGATAGAVNDALRSDPPGRN
jgi:putative membrane protein